MHDKNDADKVYFSSQFQKYSMWGEERSEVAFHTTLDRKKKLKVGQGQDKIVLKNMIIVTSFLQPVSAFHSSTTTQQTFEYDSISVLNHSLDETPHKLIS